MDVVSIALKKRQGISRYSIHARAEQRDDYPQVFTRIEVVHEVEGPGIDPEAIRRCIELQPRSTPGQHDALGRRDRGASPDAGRAARRAARRRGDGHGPDRRPDVSDDRLVSALTAGSAPWHRMGQPWIERPRHHDWERAARRRGGRP
jgi:hypothetical protein